MVAILVVTGVFLLFILFLMFRNGKVYRMRVALIYADPDAYRLLPDYFEMLFRFWIPVRRFINEAKAAAL